MNALTAPQPWQRHVVRLVYTVATLVGLWYGYDFGVRLSGQLLGVVAALNCGLCLALAVGAMAERLLLPQERHED